MLTSWEERCGIAEYSRLLVDELRKRVSLEVTPASFQTAGPEVYAAMGRALSGADVVHIQHSYAFFGGMHPLKSRWSSLARALTRPTIVTVHELDQRATGAYHLPSTLETTYKRRFNQAVFLRPPVRSWWTHSREISDALVELGAPPSHVHYRPMPLAIPERQASGVDFIRREGLIGKRLLVIPGFLSRRKGYEVALAALRELPTEYVLVAAGGKHAADHTGTEEWLKREAAQMSIGNRFRITGFLSEGRLAEAIAAAHLVLAPFREMAGSASIAYSLARGAAVIASDLPENQTLSCVRLVPAGDPTALAQAVRELAGAPAARAELSRSALEYARRHSYSSLAEEFVRHYAELAIEAGVESR
jgi:glycosyltransferase involved in cell wall biosynthesis